MFVEEIREPEGGKKIREP